MANGIFCAKSCTDKITISGAVGGDVILPVTQTGIKDISWITVKDGSHFATTNPNRIINVRSDRHEGRLYGTDNGSLYFTKLTHEDQGIYKVDILFSDKGNKCTEQLYDLTVFKKLSPEDIHIVPNVTINEICEGMFICTVNESNVTIIWSSSGGRGMRGINQIIHLPVIDTNISCTCTAQNPVSKVSRTVIPWQYCQNNETDIKQEAADYTEQNIARLTLSTCILFVLFCFFIHHMRTTTI
ncbi:SLAM family member 5-like [Pelodytes ibericus]